MDIQRKCFEESNNVNPDWSFKFDEELQQYIALDSEMELQVDEFNELWDAFRAGWQAAKAQAEKALLEQFEINNKLVEQMENMVTYERLQELIAIGVKTALESAND
ncbi:hypothetical protein [Acinetobacter towneri]|uniref:Uncharacterized protein n=1 Tax=Acinetobacter towneri TaxID=202956 RepID=A0AAP9GTM7_9GAMM|nr:hypothetical protein [Acinetobacter towneri]QGM27353.1 hypothetical protein GJD93_06535 [Acinetobacter towneri]